MQPCENSASELDEKVKDKGSEKGKNITSKESITNEVVEFTIGTITKINTLTWGRSSRIRKSKNIFMTNNVFNFDHR